MSAVQRVVYRTLEAHEYMLNLRSGAICHCGFVPDVDPKSLLTQQDYHRGHIASVIAEALS